MKRTQTQKKNQTQSVTEHLKDTVKYDIGVNYRKIWVMFPKSGVAHRCKLLP